jgi:hypothetical protein
LPYILSHDGVLAGPRLPFDAVLIAYSAFALGSFLPGVAKSPIPVAMPTE